MEVTNADRAAWANQAVHAFVEAVRMHGEDPDTVLSDLLCDLMHWADVNDVDFASCLTEGRLHYACEAEKYTKEELGQKAADRIAQVVISVRGGVAEVQSADGAEVTIIDHDNGDAFWEWSFTAMNTLGVYEKFDEYYSQAAAAASIERLRVAGYTDFSAPEQVGEDQDVLDEEVEHDCDEDGDEVEITHCGSMCEDCRREHEVECEVCRKDFEQRGI